jgi:hypothetical protein
MKGRPSAKEGKGRRDRRKTIKSLPKPLQRRGCLIT